MAHMSSSSATDLARGSSKTHASMVSLSFLGLPLLRRFFFLGEDPPTVFPSCLNPSTSDSACFDLVFYVGKRKSPFMSLGMSVVGGNNSQSFWGSDLVVLLLCMPFLAL
jgi:hypothetical protein